MKRVLITGMSGVGKSSVIEELAARGHKAVDTDGGEYKEFVGGEWLWNEPLIHQLLDTEDAEILFVSGTVRNQTKFRSEFDHVILLDAPTDVALARLRATLEIDTSTHTLDQVVDTILRAVGP